MTTSACVCRSALIKTTNVRNKNTRRMKQTNNAIKFLMAQYRAIFKNAYFKGMASAVLLTAGLAVAGGAQAVDVTDDWATATGSNLTVASGDSFNLSGTGNPSYDTGLTFAKEDSQEAATDNIIFSTDTTATNVFKVTSTGDLTLNENRSLTIGRSSVGSDVDVTFANTNVKAGATLAVEGGVSVDGSDSTYNTTDFEVTGSTGAGAATGNVNITANTSGAANLNAVTFTASRNAKVTLTASTTSKDATLNVTDSINFTDSLLNLKGTNGNATVSGKILTIGKDAVMLTDAGTNNTVSTDNFTVAKDGFKVISGAAATTETFTGHQGVIEGNVLVGADAIWKLNPTHQENALDKGETDASKAYTPNTDDIVGNVTFAAGSNVQIENYIDIQRGTLTVESGAGLYSLKNTSAGGLIQVGSSVAASLRNSEEVPTLKIYKDTLDSFLKADTEYYKIVPDGSNDYKLETTVSKDLEGTVALSYGAYLTFSDTEQVDLSAFKYATTTTAGTITVLDDSSGGTFGGIITGDNLAISQTLKDIHDTDLATNLDLQVKAKNLTLGSSTVNATKSLGFGEARAQDSLSFYDQTNTFTLLNAVVGERDYYTRDENRDFTTTPNTVGQIKGDNLTIGNISSSGSLTIEGGAWENTDRQSLTIASGSLTVTSATSGTSTTGALDYHGNTTGNPYYKNGNPSSLKWTGNFTISDANDTPANSKVEVTGTSGATATLDLRNANITWGSGTVTVKGADARISKTDPDASAGEGIIYITGNQFNSFLGSGDVGAGNVPAPTATLLNIDTDGVLFVDGPVTGDINFDEFTNETTADTAGKVNFMSGAGSGAGTLYINGGISLVTGVDVDNNGSVDSDEVANLDIGNGTIDAQTIAINNNGVASDDRGNVEVDKVTVAQGTLEVSSSLTSNNAVVEFGEGTSGATLILDTFSIPMAVLTLLALSPLT